MSARMFSVDCARADLSVRAPILTPRAQPASVFAVLERQIYSSQWVHHRAERISGRGVFCDIKRLGPAKAPTKAKTRPRAHCFRSTRLRRRHVHYQPGLRRSGQSQREARQAQAIARAIVVNSGNANACTGERGSASADMT